MKLLQAYKNSFSNLQPEVWILAISMFINRSGTMVLLFASLYFTNELHFSIAQAGIVMSFFGIGSILGSYTGGWLTDRRDHFTIMFYSLIVSGCVLLLLLTTTNIIAISCIIFFYALIADSFRPANSSAIASYSSAENRTRSVSLVRLAVNLGFSVGPAVGGFIAVLFGYKLLFVLDACTSFGAAALLYFYLPRKQIVKTKSDKLVLDDSSTSAYKDYKYLIFILLVAAYGTCFFQLFASVPQYFSKVCKYDADTIGLLMALNGFLVVVIEMPLIAFLENKPGIFRYIIWGTLCIPIAFVILQFGQGAIVWALVYTLIITMSEIFAMPFMMNFILSRGKQARQGQYAALYSIAYGLANVFAPLLGLGIANKYGFGIMFWFFIGLSLVTAVGFVLLKRRV